MCTTSMSVVEINHRLDAVADNYEMPVTSPVSTIGSTHPSASNMKQVSTNSDTTALSTEQQCDESGAGDQLLVSSDGNIDHGAAIGGDINGDDVTTDPTTSPTCRKRQLSEVDDGNDEYVTSSKRFQPCEQEKPSSPTSQDQASESFGGSSPSAGRHAPVESAVDYYDDVGYHSPTLGTDCSSGNSTSRRTLYIEYWSRTDECKERKWDHLDEIADKYGSAEEHIFATTLNGRTAFLEPNMFPYDTPAGIEHWTLWHVNELNHAQIKQYVENWIDANAPHVEQWNYDDNPERSIDIFHVHVYFQVGENDSVLQDRKVEDLVHE